MCKDETEKLLRKIETRTIHTDLNRKLEIGTDDESLNFEVPSVSHTSELFHAINNMQTFPHKKSKMYSGEQIKELSAILSKFQKDHGVIQNALKIPNSSFSRLKKRMDDGDNQWEAEIRKDPVKASLSTAEKILVKKFVQPPTSPKSLSAI